MKCLKEFDLSRELEKYKYYNKENTKQIQLKMYGLIGEERVDYILKQIDMDLLYIYNIRIVNDIDTFQIDFVVIGQEKMMLIEVKNLMDNIHISKEGKVERIIHRKTRDETYGMHNPSYQLNEQIDKLNAFLKIHSMYMPIVGYVVMANDKSVIVNDSTISNIIMYYDLKQVILNEFKDVKLSEKNYNVASLLIENHRDFNFSKFKYIQKQMMNETYVPKNLNTNEYNIYLDILKIRSKIHEQRNLPIHYIFTNKEAENLVLAKPLTKEEFMKVPGFKEKRYQMFGEEIINIFKKNQ